MNYDVLKKIKKSNLKQALFSLIYVLMFNIPLVIFVYLLITESIEISMIVAVFIFAIFAIIFDIGFYKNIKLVIFPERSDIFKKYGDIENIQKILNEINKTKIYEDKQIIISENYIYDTNDLENLVKCSDVLGVHKLVHKTNFVVDCYKIIITDKYGHEISYNYKPSQEKLCNKIMYLIGTKCKNAKLGYTKEKQDYINKNKINLSPNNTDDSYDYKCPECNCNVDYGDKFCKNCLCKLDWSDDEKTSRN